MFNVSLSSYYRRINVPIFIRQVEKEILENRIRELFEHQNARVGSAIITVGLHDQPEYASVSRQRVPRIMKEMGLKF